MSLNSVQTRSLLQYIRTIDQSLQPPMLAQLGFSDEKPDGEVPDLSRVSSDIKLLPEEKAAEYPDEYEPGSLDKPTLRRQIADMNDPYGEADAVC